MVMQAAIWVMASRTRTAGGAGRRVAVAAEARGAARRAGRAVVADLAAPLRARDAEPEAALLGNVPLLAGDEAGEDPDEALGDESGEEPGEEPA